MIQSEPFKANDLFLLTLNMNQWYDNNTNIIVINISHCAFLDKDGNLQYSSIITYSIKK